jgi:tetratricopeptide (TPR) repeat protein
MVARPLLSWRYWAAAASVVAVLGIGYYAYQQTTDQRVDMAYADTFVTGQASELTKDFPAGSLPSASRQQLLDALSDYKTGRYNEVIARLNTLPADRKTVHYKNYFLGLSYLANKQPAVAIPLLRRALAAPSLNIQQKAEWFLALAYVKNDQNEKALPILKRISTDRANPFQSTAQQVLPKIG